MTEGNLQDGILLAFQPKLNAMVVNFLKSLKFNQIKISQDEAKPRN
jgi:hypothetical protein